MTALFFTIGHGNRSLEELLDLLAEQEVKFLVDVRSYPRSERHPHFNRIALGRSLEEREICYSWEGRELGGLRKLRGRSRHIALTEEGFRAYASHMESEGFRLAVTRLQEVARSGERPALLCAEIEPSACHRSYLADYLVARGGEVRHILRRGEAPPHRLRASARLDGEILVYDRGVTQRLF